MTAYSVAEASGVSQATVSYVLNNTPNQKISDDTRAKVLAAAANLNYRPYEPARTLSFGRSSLVLFLIPDFPLGHTMSVLLDHLASLLQDIGKTLMTYRVPPGATVTDVASLISPWAVISILPLEEHEREDLLGQGIAVEILGLENPDGASPDVVPNPQETVGSLQVQFLKERGHTRLGFAAPADERLTPFAAPRLAGVRDACVSAGLAEPRALTITSSIDQVRAAVRDWVGAGITAVCGYNDEIAYAVLAGARLESITVPGDLAVIGVDDLPLSALTDPPLTSVWVDMRHLAQRLTDQLDVPEPSGPRERIDSSHIVIRESV